MVAHRALHAAEVRALGRQHEGWKHFREGREAIEAELATAPEDVRRRVRWLPIGEPVELAA